MATTIYKPIYRDFYGFIARGKQVKRNSIGYFVIEKIRR